MNLARALGITHIRHGLPWADLNPAPGRFDWSWSDAVVEHLLHIGLEPIWDLVHFGAPTWLPLGLRDPDYPEAVAAYASAFAARYQGVVNKIIPFNEPYIAAVFRGSIGIWPPFETGREGFVRSLAPIVDGLHRSTKTIRANNGAAEIWQNGAVDQFTAGSRELSCEAQLLTLERYSAFDILHGLAGPYSESYDLLSAAGFDTARLERYALDPTPVDVIGMDYYPGSEHRIELRTRTLLPHEWGQRELFVSRPDPEPAGIASIAKIYFERYGKPIFIAETSAETLRPEWLEWSTAECARARLDGVPLIGYTWWPFFDHIDWNTALSRRLTGHVCPAGLYHLQPSVEDRLETLLRDAFAKLVQVGAPAAGRVHMPSRITSVEGEAVLDAHVGELLEPHDFQEQVSSASA